MAGTKERLASVSIKGYVQQDEGANTIIAVQSLLVGSLVMEHICHKRLAKSESATSNSNISGNSGK